MIKELSTHWKEDLTFESDIDEHKIILDAKPEVGGKNRGPGPKRVLIAALTGCTGMDVASLLKKMRVSPDSFDIEAFTELTEDHPIYYKKIHLVYHFNGTDMNTELIKKAVKLSQERYCGISYMLGQSSELTYAIRINGEELLLEA